MAFAESADRLDTRDRAWVVAVARLVGREDDPIPSVDHLTAVLAGLESRGDFPSGPFRYVDAEVTRDLHDVYRAARRQVDVDGEPYLDSVVGFGHAGFLAMGLTRSGRIAEDEPQQPTHVLLADVESIIVDMRAFAEEAALDAGHVGRVEVLVGIACEVPDQPLMLRHLDQATGVLLPPDESLTTFTPIISSFEAGPGHAGRAAWCWENGVIAAEQFGAVSPQLVVPPMSEADDEPTAAGTTGTSPV